MSKRRQANEWVWLKPMSGFVGESHKYRAEIQPEEDPMPCMLDCGDPDCVEWANVWTEEVDGQRFPLYHVSECRILDEPYKE